MKSVEQLDANLKAASVELCGEEMVARGREVTGDASFDIADPAWVSHGTFRHGVAPGYGAGRVFLVGDAAHANLPIGGQGMNSGFIDAVSLA